MSIPALLAIAEAIADAMIMAIQVTTPDMAATIPDRVIPAAVTVAGATDAAATNPNAEPAAIARACATPAGEIVAAEASADTRECLATLSARFSGTTLILETGTHSPWVSRLVAGWSVSRKLSPEIPVDALRSRPLL